MVSLSPTSYDCNTGLYYNPHSSTEPNPDHHRVTLVSNLISVEPHGVYMFQLIKHRQLLHLFWRQHKFRSVQHNTMPPLPPPPPHSLYYNHISPLKTYLAQPKSGVSNANIKTICIPPFCTWEAKYVVYGSYSGPQGEPRKGAEGVQRSAESCMMGVS